MKSLRSSLPCLLMLVLPFAATDTVFADGKFFRQLEVADEPGIQAQRAAIVFKDGVETLIVQSDVEGEGTSYGWLLPLPAEPTSIEPCAANALNALTRVVHPEVAGTPKLFVAFSVLFLLVAAVTCHDHLGRKDRGTVRASVMSVLSGVVILLVLATLWLPALSSAGLAECSDVEVLQTTKAGVYDVTIIKGRTEEAVRSWLASNGFACPASANEVIRGYVAKEWCFLAAKVTPNAKGPVAHHPLKIAFPTSVAIYPLRLTGSDGDPIQLDLFVIAKRQATAAGMQTWFCDRYPRGKVNHYFGEHLCETPPIYASQETPISRIGIPDVSTLMWPGCVVTRLHARLDASEMREDLNLTWLPTRPGQAALYSLGGAAALSSSVAAIALAMMLAWFTRTAIKRGWSWRMMLRRRLAFAVLLGLLAGGVHYMTLYVVLAKDTGREAARSWRTLVAHGSALSALSGMPPDSPFPKAYRELVAEHWPDAIQEPETDLENPGDFKIETADEGWRLTIVDWDYIPCTILIASDGTPKPATN